MNLEDIAVVMKLFDNNVDKLLEKLYSYQRDVKCLSKLLSEKWVNGERLDRHLVALHDYLVGSLSEVNTYLIKLNLHIELNRPDGRLRKEGYTGDSFDGSNSINHSNSIEEVSTQESHDQLPEKDSIEKSPKENTQLVPIDLSLAARNESTCSYSSENLDEDPKVFQPIAKDHEVAVSLSPPVVLKDVLQKSTQANLDEISNQKHGSPLVNKTFPEEPTVNNVDPSAFSSATVTKEIMASEKISQSAPDCSKLANSKNSNSETDLQIKKSAVAALPSSWLVEPNADQGTASNSIHKQPKAPSNQCLLAPKGGTPTTSNGIYNQVIKNMASFPEKAIVSAVLVHVNIAENCIFVAKWNESSQPIIRILQGEVQLREIQQLPDYGEIFAVLDSSDQIITRVTINASSAGGGYDAYLIDYGEHIHLNGNETIYELPDNIKRLPAEAIKCHLSNCKVTQMSSSLYQMFKLCVQDNNGIDLVVELMELEENANRKDSTNSKPETECPGGLSKEDMEMLNDFGKSTSDPLKAVLGFKPTDEQRICRHYDPKLKGCFKGSSCRLVHEPLAPYGATKDVEVAEPLPETVFDTPVPNKEGDTVRILITYVNSPTEIYGQFLDGSPPLVWDKNDVPEAKRIFKRKPHVLDIVLALYSDNCYYRAQIVDEMDREYKVFYVDYGNSDFVSLSSLAPCDYVERLKPHKCISCQIEGVIRSSFLTSRKTLEGVEFLKAKLINQELDVKLVSRLPDGFLVRFLGDYADVPKQLIKRGYAEPSGGLQRNSEDEADYDQLSAAKSVSSL
ncbi:uncharacterized protein LOC108093866 [Drosophila ficusphila]|uniref:uncharacterized protein LOC108093866 n=1 Tax=Drosophila ficusphila TaxID=30025 RepID=UPI0007E5D189|nr:uncharacterized protein LOC108093866 [Drosophila ficusphila]